MEVSLNYWIRNISAPMEDKLNMIKVENLSNHSWNIFVQSQFLVKFMNIYLNEYENN